MCNRYFRNKKHHWTCSDTPFSTLCPKWIHHTSFTVSYRSVCEIKSKVLLNTYRLGPGNDSLMCLGDQDLAVLHSSMSPPGPSQIISAIGLLGLDPKSCTGVIVKILLWSWTLWQHQMWLPSNSLCYSFILAFEVTDTVMTTMTEDLLHFVVMRDVLQEVGQSFPQLVFLNSLGFMVSLELKLTIRGQHCRQFLQAWSFLSVHAAPANSNKESA